MSDRAERRRVARNGVTPLAGLWLSNAPWAATGYGTQTAQVVSRMAADGHRMAVGANYGLEATNTDWNGIEVYPKGFDPYSNDVVAAYYADWKRQHPDVKPQLFTLYDTWVFKAPAFDELPVASWVPIDHTPVPPSVAAYCSKPNVTPIAMSMFGSEQLTRLGIKNTYIPHAIETSVMKPTHQIETGNGTRTSKQLMGVDEGKFVVGVVNANKGVSPNRKAFGEQLLAFSIFAADKPDAVLYMHAERSASMGGIAFDTLIHACGLKPEQVVFVNQYQNRMGIPSDVLACIYTGFDVLLAATYGEGFGITVIDAQACGTPVIVNNFTAQPELVGDGWKVNGQPLWDAAQSAWFNVPNIESIVNALNQSYERRGEGKSAQARKYIEDNYDADVVYENMWRPFLASL
jgi:glycosyltransferase involved in cell wall biosynthesis